MMSGSDSRLTHRTPLGAVARTYPEDFTIGMDSKTYSAYEETINRLCEYEDTELTPAEIIELKKKSANSEPVKHSKDYSNGFGDGVKNFFDMLCIEIEMHSYETSFDYLATIDAIKEVYDRLTEVNDEQSSNDKRTTEMV